jgi:hypothetical protein
MSPHREVAADHIASDPAIEIFYHNNYIPLQYHEIPSFNCWKNLLFEINMFFNGKIELEELWNKIEWLQKRYNVVHKLAL